MIRKDNPNLKRRRERIELLKRIHSSQNRLRLKDNWIVMSFMISLVSSSVQYELRMAHWKTVCFIQCINSMIGKKNFLNCRVFKKFLVST